MSYNSHLINQLCYTMRTNDSDMCCIFAPTTEYFSARLYEFWGWGGIAFLCAPPILTAVMIAIYVEEVYYILLKGDSKQLINSLCWLLGMYPTIMFIGTIAVFIPRAVVYLMFIYPICFAFAMYKYYYLIIAFGGDAQSFVDKSRNKSVGLNQMPFCCVMCMPKVCNSMRLTRTAKWFIQQNIILTPIYGALAVILNAYGKLYSINGGISVSFILLSIFNAIAMLMCLYGLKLISELALNIDRMEEVHTITGKTRVMQLMMLVLGFEGMIFNLLEQFHVIKCKPPLNFATRTHVIFNYAVVIQVFFLGLLARHFYRRSDDIQRQEGALNHKIISDNDNQDVYTAVNAFCKQNYGATNEADYTSVLKIKDASYISA